MRCHICDTLMEDPKIDPRDGKYRPCSDCEEAIGEIILDSDPETVYNSIENKETFIEFKEELHGVQGRFGMGDSEW